MRASGFASVIEDTPEHRIKGADAIRRAFFAVSPICKSPSTKIRKNLFSLAEIVPQRPAGEHLDCLVQLKDRISTLMAAVREIFDANEKEQATELIVEAKKIEDFCTERINALIRRPDESTMAPTYVLAYRYFKRATAHVRNVASSLVQPLHKIDFTSKIVSKAEAKSQRRE